MIDNAKFVSHFPLVNKNIITFDLLQEYHLTTWKEYYLNHRKDSHKEMHKSLKSVDWDALFSNSDINRK